MNKTFFLICSLCILLPSNLKAQNQKVITTADSLQLTSKGGALDNIYIPSIEGVSEEVLGACEPFWYSYYVGRIYPHEFNSRMISDEFDWIVLNDTLHSDTAFTLIKANGHNLFTKFYPGGQIIQQGELSVLKPENLKYNYQDVPSQDIAYCRKWIDSVYTSLTIATGPWKFYHQNGQIASEGSYEPKTTASATLIIDPYSGEEMYDLPINDYTDAQKVGKWNYYDDQGTLVLSQTFENGQVISMWCLP